ncbi:ABC transporter ATP-binding protein [Lachnoclostridium phytofermentans]|uniref:ABC transporter ATP-binding protein n=1 Tax=Lachnoclostridium phytofermentans TaxID=66219 RepID=UPI000A7A6B29|nr:ABC transporter ATP-binding protein [Lachnoclostridium phytofermentans]
MNNNYSSNKMSVEAINQHKNSSDDIMIEVKDISVRFNLSNQKIDNLKEYFIRLIKRKLVFQEFFALKNVSFNVHRGESWGIIGSNGSGKSTLLKVISGIIKPYTGNIKINGTVAPLIELGAGFDGNLTARENIFLNGCVLGHSIKFMEEHFDEIVKFAELDEFLDSPIKNYSSGMVARLAFSVATIVNAEILIVDEILSVGDISFKQKCEKRMEEMRNKGVTLLYVSHSIDEVKRICDKVIWLNKGEIKMVGNAVDVCDEYIKVMKR